MNDRSVNQVEFARILQRDKSYVTRLKQHGRLVMDEAGLILVDASIRRIEETKGGRDDVAGRHARLRRVEETLLDQGFSTGAIETIKDAYTESVVESRAGAQTRKEKAQADIAEMERDQLRGKLIERELVEQALADVVAFARQGIENLPHRVAGQLVGKDFDAIMATLKQEVVTLMGDMHREAAKGLAELTKVEA